MKLDPQKYFPQPEVANFVEDVQQGNVPGVKEGLKIGISPNATGENGFRPIYFSFFSSDTATLEILLASGADPNAPLHNRNTPLHFAVRLPNPDFTRVLLAHGADPNARGENDKPVMHEALTSHQPSILTLLSRAGGNPDVVWGGTTPLLAAMKMFLWNMAATLVDLEADLAFRDNTGKNAIERFCFQVKKVPPTPENKKTIPLLAAALRRRGGVIPCATEIGKFD